MLAMNVAWRGVNLKFSPITGLRMRKLLPTSLTAMCGLLMVVGTGFGPWRRSLPTVPNTRATTFVLVLKLVPVALQLVL